MVYLTIAPDKNARHTKKLNVTREVDSGACRIHGEQYVMQTNKEERKSVSLPKIICIEAILVANYCDLAVTGCHRTHIA